MALRQGSTFPWKIIFSLLTDNNLFSRKNKADTCIYKPFSSSFSRFSSVKTGSACIDSKNNNISKKYGRQNAHLLKASQK